MDIHNHGNNLKIHFPVKPTAQNSNSVAGSKAENEVVRTGDVNATRLLQQLESGDVTRKQLLVEIQAKIQSGEYETRAAVERAAANIVGE